MDLKLENMLIQFEKRMIAEQQKVIRHSYDRTNLTTQQQQHMMKTLLKNKQFIILNTDKT